MTRVIEHLRREQANAFGLYLQYQGYHWNVAGPLFRDLHLLFDEHANTVLETVDDLAERQRMLGALAGYTLEDIGGMNTLPEESGAPATVEDMIARLQDSHRRVIEDLKSGFRAAEDHDDPGSADLFARIVQHHERMEWFLREILAGRTVLLRETSVRPAQPAEAVIAGR